MSFRDKEHCRKDSSQVVSLLEEPKFTLLPTFIASSKGFSPLLPYCSFSVVSEIKSVEQLEVFCLKPNLKPRETFSYWLLEFELFPIIVPHAPSYDLLRNWIKLVISVGTFRSPLPPMFLSLLAEDTKQSVRRKHCSLSILWITFEYSEEEKNSQ